MQGYRELKPGVFPNGYVYVRLTKSGVRFNSLLHRLLAAVFIPNPKNLPEVNHKDLNKVNNHLDNLEWVTKSENAYHSFANNKTRIKNYTSKPVIDLNTGVFYNSAKELSALYGFKEPSLRGKLNGNDTNKTSFAYA